MARLGKYTKNTNTKTNTNAKAEIGSTSRWPNLEKYKVIVCPEIFANISNFTFTLIEVVFFHHRSFMV